MRFFISLRSFAESPRTRLCLLPLARSFAHSLSIRCTLLLLAVHSNYSLVFSCTFIIVAVAATAFLRIFDCFLYWKFQRKSILSKWKILLTAWNESWKTCESIIRHSKFVEYTPSLPPFLPFRLYLLHSCRCRCCRWYCFCNATRSSVWFSFIYFKFNPSLRTWKLSWALEG